MGELKLKALRCRIVEQCGDARLVAPSGREITAKDNELLAVHTFHAERTGVLMHVVFVCTLVYMMLSVRQFVTFILLVAARRLGIVQMDTESWFVVIRAIPSEKGEFDS